MLEFWRNTSLFPLMFLIAFTICPVAVLQAGNKAPSPPDSVATSGVEPSVPKDSVPLLVRDFLQDQEDDRFGYFVYLIFSEQTQSTYNKRLAAAEEFMCQASTTEPALALGLKQSDLIMFGAPIKKRTNKNRLVRSQSVMTFLKEYHYVGAAFLLRQLNVRSTPGEERFNFRIGLVGSSVPLLSRMAKVDPDTVQVLRLDTKSSYQIAMTVREFQRALRFEKGKSEGVAVETRADFEARMQNHFTRVRALKFPTRPNQDHMKKPCQ